MGQLTLFLAIHNHQPDGNFGHVFQQAYDDCYRPLLHALAEFPRVRVALHHTGPLFEWLEREHGDYLDLLGKLVDRGQVELLGGGFYEPMLAVLPERDAVGQIQMMSDYCERRFGVRPEGMWLAERVWEPALAKTIADTGTRFTLVDDGHFRYAGLSGPLRGYYVTEKAGSPLALFPIDKALRSAIPFLKAWESVDVLDKLLDEGGGGDQAVTYGDDGEKFGVWPHTKEWVWGQGWLREFLRLLTEREERVVTGHFGAYMKAHPPTGRVYLPTASYEEMGEWALPALAQQDYLAVRKDLEQRGELEKARPFIRGGIWQSFLAKYPEANFMHKKMVLVSDKLERAEEKLGAQATAVLGGARRELYRAQCNCCYWHGLFGGLYLNYLRDTVYRHLIEAEREADRALATHVPSAHVADLDADFQDEVSLESGSLTAYVKPSLGGAIYELDFIEKRFNLCNVLGRRPEGYHERLREAATRPLASADGPVSIHDMNAVKSTGLDALLAYDRHPRLTFIDHFFDPVPGAELVGQLEARADVERGDFAGAPYTLVKTQGGPGAPSATLRREGNVLGTRATVEKVIAVSGRALTCDYRVTLAGQPRPVTFASELNLTLLAGDAEDRYYEAPGQSFVGAARRLVSRGVVAGGALWMVDDWQRLRIKVRGGAPDPLAEVWRYPLETASQSEGGFERTYQGSVLLVVWPAVQLGEGQPLVARVTLEVEAIEDHASSARPA